MPVTPVERDRQLAEGLRREDPLSQMEAAGIPRMEAAPEFDMSIVDTPLAGSALEVRKSPDLQLVANQNDPFASLQQAPQQAPQQQQQDPFGSLVQQPTQVDPFASVVAKPEAEGLVASGLRKIGHSLIPLAGSLPGMSVGGDIGFAVGTLTAPVTGPIGPIAGSFIGAGIGAAITGYVAAKGQSYILDAIGYHDEAQQKANEEAHPIANALENIAEAGIAFSVGSAPIAQRAMTAGGLGALTAVTQYLQTGEVSKLDVAEAMIGGAIFSTPRPWAMRLMPHVLTPTPRAPTETEKLPEESQKFLKETTQDVQKGFVESQVKPAAEQLALDLGAAPKVEDTAHYRSLEREKQVLMRAARPDDVPRIAKIEAEQQALRTGTPQPDQLDKILTPEALAQSSELGIIGPKPASAEIEGKTPAQLAKDIFPPDEFPGPSEVPKNIAARMKPPEGISEPVRSANPAVDKAGNIRMDLIETAEDVKNVMRQAAAEHDGYMEARRGEIKLNQIEALSWATGIAPDKLDIEGISRRFLNDRVLRTYTQAMVQAATNVRDAAKVADTTGKPEDLAKFVEARMRQSLIQEQVAGLTAEWGRTGNVFQEFRERVKDAKTLGEFVATKKGETLEDVKKLASAVAELPTEQIPGMLNKLRHGTFDNFMWYWTNNLLSGPYTHTAYAISNKVWQDFNSIIVTPIAGAIGGVREQLGYHDTERVYAGEGPARLWASYASVPDALEAAYKAVKSGLPEILPPEWQGEKYQQYREAYNAFTQQRNPFAGTTVGKVIGAPSNVIAGIHTFFGTLGMRADVEARAYRQAAKEGLNPASDAFWARKQQLSSNPPEAWREPAMKAAADYTFTQRLGVSGKAFQEFQHTSVGRWSRLLMPFTRVPFNILKGTQSISPLAFANKDMRANLLGERGPIERDTQWAKLVAGSAVSAFVMGLAANDWITGDYPLDPEEKHRWEAIGKEPLSIRIGDTWVSYRKFGSIGALLSATANLYRVAGKLTEAKYAEAAEYLVMGAVDTLADAAGMQGLFNAVQALKDPLRYGARYVSGFASTLVPYSTFLRQMSSSVDPYMRRTTSFIDGLKYEVPLGPFGRQSLQPERDWLGNLLPNPGYGTGSIIRHTPARETPVNMEMNRLQLNPTPPSDRIGGIKLSPEVYDELQSRAGPFTYMMLDKIVNQPNWQQMPVYLRTQMIESIIKSTREAAKTIVQMRHPSIIQQQFEITRDRITGAKIGTKKIEPMKAEQ